MDPSQHGQASSYQAWLVTHERKLFLPDEQVPEQIASFAYRPLLSILLPTFNTDLRFLERCFHSVLQQRYPNWQLCVIDDASSDDQVVKYIESVAAGDARVQLRVSAENSGISVASNMALQLAEGDFIVLLDHDDELHPFALLEAVAALNRYPDADLIYSDEDKIDPDGHRVCPAFKPEFDMDVFLSFDYLGHMIALRRSVAVEIGGFRSSCNGAQDWDLLVRAVELIGPQRVRHIPKPLYHWRMHADSTALDLHSKPYVRRAWSKVLADYLERNALAATVEPGLFFGSMRVKRELPAHIRTAVFLRTEDGGYQKAALAPNILEPNILELNGEPGRVTFYELLGSSVTGSSVTTTSFDPHGAAGREMVRWIWSMEQITEEVLVFINRPLETVNHSFFEELAAQAMRDDCGLVTGISVDSGRTIHTGLISGPEGELMDPFAGLAFPQDGYLGQLSVVREVETISDEFFAIRREHLARVGGLGCVSASFMPRLVEQLTFCAHERGLRVLATPYAVATFEGVWPSKPQEVGVPRDGTGLRLNSNLANFANLREVLSGNV